MTDSAEIPGSADNPPDTAELWNKMNFMQTQIKGLQDHDDKCDAQHSFWKERDEHHREYQEKNNEVMKKHTDSMLSLSSSLSEVNDTVKKILPIIERATKEYTIRDWIRKEGIPWVALLLGVVLSVKHLFGG